MKKSLIWALSAFSLSVSADDDLRYLAEAIYFEGRSEPVPCQIIIAKSILTRVSQARFDDTIKEVVHRKDWSPKYKKYVCQYSYFCDGKPDTLDNHKAELTSYQVASHVLYEDTLPYPVEYDHYYAHNIVTPSWSSSMKNVFVCGNHTFGSLSWRT